jgi:outer membrane protein TolC
MRKGVRATGIWVLSAALVGCGLKDPPPFDPRAIQARERAGALDARPMYMPPLPTTLEALTTEPTSAPDTPGRRGRPRLAPTSRATTGPSISENPTIRMSLQEIIQRSVANSLEVRVSGYDPAVAKTRILEAQAHFDPVFFSKLTYTDQKILSPASGILPGVNPFAPDVFRTLDGQVGVRQNLPAGGQIELHSDVQRIQRLPISAGELNPYVVNDLALQITQPLMRNLGFDINQARITLARNDYKVSVLDYRKALEENLAQIERSYWQLVEAVQEEQIQEDLLRRSRDTYNILLGRIGGDISRVQTSEAAVAVENRGVALIDAKARIFDQSDDIKRRMNDPEFPVAGAVLILPADQLDEIPVHFNLDDEVKTGLSYRFELGQQAIREESASVAARVAQNNLLVKLDLISTFDIQGPGQDFGHAFANQGKADFFGASVGLSLEWPLGNREARSIYRRAQLQRVQAGTQYANLVAQVTQEVKTAHRTVETAWNDIAGRRRATFQAQDALAALEEKRELGAPLDYQFVQSILDAQDRLGEAQRQEALAVASYYANIAGLERAKGTILRYNNIVMQEDKFESMEK